MLNFHQTEELPSDVHQVLLEKAEPNVEVKVSDGSLVGGFSPFEKY